MAVSFEAVARTSRKTSTSLSAKLLIKTVEDLHEALAGVSQAFGLASHSARPPLPA